MRKALRVAFTICFGGTAIVAGLAVTLCGRRFAPPGPLVQDEHFHEYEVRIYYRYEERLVERICDRLPGWLSDFVHRVIGRQEYSGAEIVKDGRRVFSVYGADVRIADFGSNSVVGMDITGDGVPNVALSDRCGRLSGGSLWVFECGKKFRQIARVDSLGSYPELRDLDGDGFPEVIASDDAFYHWPICRDGEPMTEVILRWRNGKYVAARDLMYKPAPPIEELEATAAAIRSSPEWDAESGWAPPELWTNAIALMYSGHESLAWELVDKAWKPGLVGKEELLCKKQLTDHYLLSRLEESVYWPDLKTQCSTNHPQ